MSSAAMPSDEKIDTSKRKYFPSNHLWLYLTQQNCGKFKIDVLGFHHSQIDKNTFCDVLQLLSTAGPKTKYYLPPKKLFLGDF